MFPAPSVKPGASEYYHGAPVGLRGSSNCIQPVVRRCRSFLAGDLATVRPLR